MGKPITFEEFIASKIAVPNTNVLWGGLEEEPPIPGFVYLPHYEKGELCGGFFIDALADGTYDLIICNEEWVDADLAKLERILWDEFADGELNSGE